MYCGMNYITSCHLYIKKYNAGKNKDHFENLTVRNCEIFALIENSTPRVSGHFFEGEGHLHSCSGPRLSSCPV